jgi:hypothetical protein
LYELVYGVKARLDEYDTGYIGKEQLRYSLSRILGSYSIGRKPQSNGSSSRSFTVQGGSLPSTLSPVRMGLVDSAVPPRQMLAACG